MGSEGPQFVSGQDRVTRARRQSDAASLGRRAPGSVGSGTVSRGSSASTRAAARAFSSGVSPGMGTKVPLDCSPAIASAAACGSRAVSIR